MGIDDFFGYLKSVPWTAVISSPFGSFKPPGYGKRLLVYHDGQHLLVGGFTSRGKIGSGYVVNFMLSLPVSQTQWFTEETLQIPKAWKKEHVSFFFPSRPLNISCPTPVLPNTTKVSVEFSQDHPLATQMTKWGEVNKANLHYANVAALELVLQWFNTRTDWRGPKDVKFLIGYDKSQWFLAGVSQNGLVAFHPLDSVLNWHEALGGFFMTLEADTMSELMVFCPPNKKDELKEGLDVVRADYINIAITEPPIDNIVVSKQITVDPFSMLFLSGLLPRKVTHV